MTVVDPGRRRDGRWGRREVLRAGLAAVAAAAASEPARAQQKLSPAEAAYQDHPKDGFACAACAQFRAPTACAVVSGTISPQGWCRLFDLPD